MTTIEKQNEDAKNLGGFPHREQDKQLKSAFEKHPNSTQPGHEAKEEETEEKEIPNGPGPETPEGPGKNEPETK